MNVVREGELEPRAKWTMFECEEVSIGYIKNSCI